MFLSLALHLLLSIFLYSLNLVKKLTLQSADILENNEQLVDEKESFKGNCET